MTMIKYKIERGNNPLKNGTYPLYLRLTQDRKLKRISLGFSIENRFYNANATLDSKNWIRSNHPASVQLNDIIFNKIDEARAVTTELKSDATIETVINKMKVVGNGSMMHSFSDYADTYVERFNGREYNTYRGKKSSLNRFKEFLTSKGCKNLLFSELTLQTIKDFDTYLNLLHINHNTAEKELSRLRAIVREAVRDDKLSADRDPFRKFQLHRKKSDKIRLTQEEIDNLQKLELPSGSLIWNVRNAYIFSFYCAGIRCGDLLQLRWNNIIDGRLCYQMNKTSQVIKLKITKNAQNILNLYDSKSNNSNFIFPFLKDTTDYSDNWFLKKEISSKNVILNSYLKKLSIKAGINKSISMHTARHSFANISCQKTKDIRAVSMALGHSNIRITQHYLDSFDTNAVDNVMDLMFE